MKRQAALLVLCLVLAAAILLCGCAQNSSALPEKVDMLYVNMVLPHNDDGYWSEIVSGINAALETAPEISVKTLFPAENYNVDQMTDLIWRSVYSKVDAIVTQGNDNEAFVEALQAARAEGIIVLLVDTDLASSIRDAYIGTNNYAAGKQLAQKVAEDTNGKAKVGILIGDVSFPNMKQRLRAVEDTFSAYDNIEICTVLNDEYSAARVLTQYEEIQQNYPQVDTLVCLEGTGLSALSEVFLQKEPQMRVFGFDLTLGQSDVILREGLIYGLVVQDTYGMGVKCIQLLQELHENGSIRDSLYYLDSYFLTQENLDEYMEKGHI